MKYIDSEKLIAEIESELSAHDKVDHLEAFEAGKAWNRGHRKALENIRSFITSLQQEQPEVEFEVKFAEFLEIKDAELGANSWSEEDLRELAEYFYFNNKQPEVDLEKEVKSWKKKHGVVGVDDLWLNFARHFYELGLNARKEK